jgi:hypothetical protein
VRRVGRSLLQNRLEEYKHVDRGHLLGDCKTYIFHVLSESRWYALRRQQPQQTLATIIVAPELLFDFRSSHNRPPICSLPHSVLVQRALKLQRQILFKANSRSLRTNRNRVGTDWRGSASWTCAQGVRDARRETAFALTNRHSNVQKTPLFCFPHLIE